MSEAQLSYSFDNGVNDDSVTHLYRYAAKAEKVDGFGGVGEAEVAAYREQGYLVVGQAFSKHEVQAALDGITDLIDGKYAGFRGIQFAPEVRDRIDQLAPEERYDSIRKLNAFLDHEERLRAMCFDPRLMATLDRLFGEPAQLFDNDGQAHLKPPLIGREKPWHQDHAYFNLPMGTPVAGVWIALDEATPDNGCMHVIPGSHKEGPVVHFRRRDWQICDTDVAVARCVAAEMQPGDLLFFDGLIHHGTPPNRSGKRRRALQFHYHPQGVGSITSEERMAVFGSEGKDVTC